MTEPPLNVAAHLPILAATRPHSPAVVYPHARDRSGRVAYTHLTFQQLDDESDALARGLHRAGIGPGTRCALMVPPSLEFFALTFALLKATAVPVLIDPGMGVRNLGKCLSEAQPAAFIGVPKAHAARRVLGWGRPHVRLTVAVGRPRLGSTFTLDEIRDLGTQGDHATPLAVTADMHAAILFTSGSTGVAKGAVYTHGIFAAQVEALRTLFDIRPGEIDLATFPLFALFGPALGMTAIVPDMDPTRPARVDPRKIFEAVANFGVTNLFGSPALLNRVGRYGAERGVKLPSLRRVLSAGASVSASVIERFAGLLSPGVEVFTPYGATEALPVACIGSAEVLGETRAKTDRGAGVCVGRPVPGLQVRIVRISDEPIREWSDSLILPTGETGEVAVKGPWVTPAYLNRPQATTLAKIPDPAGGFWHRMGDLGCLDELGRLWFRGRKSHRVETSAGPLYTIPVEAVFNTHADVFRSALVGVRKGAETIPVLWVELEASAKRRSSEAIRRELLDLGSRFDHTKGVRTILFHPAFPVDVRHNAKIFREKLALQAARVVR